MAIASWINRAVTALFFCSATLLSQALELRWPAINGTQFSFTLDCETNAIYLIEHSTNLVEWAVVARNAEVTTNRSLSFSNSLLAGDYHAFFRARRTNEPLFQFAMSAKHGISMNGQNLRTDSFDSATNSPYNDGFGHYTNGPGTWKANGDIACNDTLTNASYTGSVNIFGKVATGPAGTVNLGSSGMIGDEAWQSDPSHYGMIQPGWFTEDMNISFPSVVVPTTNATWQAVNGNSLFGVINGETYDIILAGGVLGADYYMSGNQVLSGKIYVIGKVRLLVPTKINMSGTDKITLAPGARFQLFADCAIASIGGNGVQNPGMAADFCFFGTDTNTRLAYGGNAAFAGVFYAPNADMTLSGGGGGLLDFSGSVMAKTIKLTGNFSFHYDESLKHSGWQR
jgi:hypothetical protein